MSAAIIWQPYRLAMQYQRISLANGFVAYGCVIIKYWRKSATMKIWP